MVTKAKISDEEALARFESGEGFDPADSRDRTDTAEIRAAVLMRQAASELVDKAVTEARGRGLTWVEIGLALGVSPQAARKRYLSRT